MVANLTAASPSLSSLALPPCTCAKTSLPSGTLIGPVLGAAFFMLMEHQLSAWTEAWALYFGLIFIAFVLFAPQGIRGLAATRLRRADPNPWPRP